jgi:hypothetical protein
MKRKLAFYARIEIEVDIEQVANGVDFEELKKSEGIAIENAEMFVEDVETEEVIVEGMDITDTVKKQFLGKEAE